MEARGHLYWIDWLKVLAVLGVFYYHAALIFAYVPWLISNPSHSLVLSGIAGLGFLFGMPLLFVLSGAASWFAIEHRSAWQFAALRFRRLVLPLAAGLVLLSPLQAYLATASRGPAGSLLAFYGAYFEGVRLYWSPRWLGAYGYHLWFLGFLFLYSVLSLPMLAWLRRPAGRRALAAIARACENGLGLLLFLVPMALVQVALRVRYPALLDWSDFCFWLVFFVSGYVLVSDPRITAAVAARQRFLFMSALVLTAALLPLIAAGRLWDLEGAPRYTIGGLAYLALRSCLTWAWVLTIVALGVRRLNRPARFLGYASEAVMPFYVLHHPAVVLVGYLVIQRPGGVFPKFAVVVVCSFALTMAAYELLVRHVPPMRALFGLRPLPRGGHVLPTSWSHLEGG